MNVHSERPNQESTNNEPPIHLPRTLGMNWSAARPALLAVACVVALAACGRVNIDGPGDGNAGDTALKTGQFYNVVHLGKGQAQLIRDSSGKLVVRLSNFEVENGPDLYVYGSSVATPDGKNINITNSFSLGKLSGASDYIVPAGKTPEDLNSVVIWCQAFGVNFISAGLQGK
jgi:hypothetical protein